MPQTKSPKPRETKRGKRRKTTVKDLKATRSGSKVRGGSGEFVITSSADKSSVKL